MHKNIDVRIAGFERIATVQIDESSTASAVLAAAGHLGGVEAAARQLVRIAHTIMPDPGLVSQYHERYGDFRAELKRRGYL